MMWKVVFVTSVASVSASQQVFCPSSGDLVQTWNSSSSPVIYDQGWRIQGGGGVATRSSFNLLGGR